MTLDEARAEATRQSWASWTKRHVITMPATPDQYFVVTDNEWLDLAELDEAILISTYDAEGIANMFII